MDNSKKSPKCSQSTDYTDLISKAIKKINLLSSHSNKNKLTFQVHKIIVPIDDSIEQPRVPDVTWVPLHQRATIHFLPTFVPSHYGDKFDHCWSPGDYLYSTWDHLRSTYILLYNDDKILDCQRKNGLFHSISARLNRFICR